MSNYNVASIFTAVDKFSSPVSKMGRTADSTFAKMDRQLRKVGNQAFAVSKKSAMIGGAIALPLIVAGKSAVDFEEKMTNVATLIDTSKESMTDMGNSVMDMAKRLPVPLEELTTSLYDIRSAGIAADKAMNTLEVSAKLSAAGLSTTSEATDIMTSSLNAFASQNLSAEETANILFKTVKFGKTTISQMAQSFGQSAPTIAAAGVSLQDFSAATSALTTTGTPASVAQNRLAMSIAKLNKPTAEMEKLFNKLGVSSGKELIASSENLVDVFTKLDKAAQENNINITKAWGSNEAYSASVALMGEQNKAYVETLADMNSGTDSLTGAFDKQKATGKANMQVLKNNLEVVSVKLGTALLPVVTKLAESLLPVIENVVAWIDRNPRLTKQIALMAVKGVALFGAISAVSFAIGGLTKVVHLVMGVTKLYNVVLGVSGAFMKAAPIAIGRSSVALKSYAIATKIASAAQAVFNAVSNLNPVFLIITGVGLLTAALYGLSNAFDGASASERLNNEVSERALSNTRDQRVEAAILFEKLRNLETGTAAYNTELAKLEQMQPGITAAYDLQRGSVEKLNKAEKALTDSLMEKAKAQAMADLAQEKFKEAYRKQEEGPSFWTKAYSSVFTPTIDQNAVNNIEAQILENDARGLIEKSAKMQAEQASATPIDTSPKGGLIGSSGSLNGGTNSTETITKEQQELNINLMGLPNGATANLTGGTGTIRLGTTN